MTRTMALQYLWQWVVGSLALGAIVAAVGALVTYAVAMLVRKE